MNISNLYFLDGMDLWTNFGVGIEKGSADFLGLSPRKESTQHNWADANGVDVDLSGVFLDQREGTLNCWIIATSEIDFWEKKTAFFNLLTKPGLRRLTITAHGQKSYYIYYKNCHSWNQTKALTGDAGDKLIAQKFSLDIVEPEPQLDATNIFIVTEDGKFLIT